MRKLQLLEETRCYECGKWIFGGTGCRIGDENWEVPQRSLCNDCIEKLHELIKEG